MTERVLRSIMAACITAALTAGCTESIKEKEDPLAGDIIDEVNLSQLMLTVGDPKSAVSYFEKAMAREPERADFRRNLARSYAKAQRFPEASRTYQELMALQQDEPSDRLDYAYVAIRLDRWDDATALAGSLPESLDTPRRHLLDAMVADHTKDWETADAAYARAEQQSPNPAETLNNWGVSLMSRGELAEASKTFEKAVSYDSRLFSAKNNLAISRGLRGDYRIPVVPMTEEERAIIYHNLGVIALRKGDTRTARGLFAAAVDHHPRHYQQAADRLAQLDGAILN
ncbi:MAG: tetratricopeptide repeat protein [Pseudomonadota bacterium]